MTLHVSLLSWFSLKKAPGFIDELGSEQPLHISTYLVHKSVIVKFILETNKSQVVTHGGEHPFPDGISVLLSFRIDSEKLGSMLNHLGCFNASKRTTSRPSCLRTVAA